MTSAISSLMRIWKISYSYPGCTFVWKIRVVYFSVKHSYLCNKYIYIRDASPFASAFRLCLRCFEFICWFFVVYSAVFGSVLTVLRYSITTLEMGRSLCVIESANKVNYCKKDLPKMYCSYCDIPSTVWDYCKTYTHYWCLQVTTTTFALAIIATTIKTRDEVRCKLVWFIC